MKIKIEEIEVQKIYPLRQSLLRKGKPLSSCHLDGDTDLETIHLGAFTSEKLIGIASAFLNPCPQFLDKKGVQLRAIAVLPNYQRKGVASKLIVYALDQIKKQLNPEFVWLNGRVDANPLYISNGFQTLGDTFEINSIGLHQRFYKNLFL